MKRLRWWFNYLRYADSRHPSWIVTYRDGHRTYPLRRENAETLARMYGGVSIDYCRDENGDLLP